MAFISDRDRKLGLIDEPGEAMQYFATLAKSRSVGPSKNNGGELGWVLPAQALPALGTVMVNLKEGTFSQLPIQTQQGWSVLKVEEKRPFKIPSLEESRAVVLQTLQQMQRQNYIQELIKSAKITK